MNNQIKVTQTRIHKVPYMDNQYWNESIGRKEAPIADGKLVLIGRNTIPGSKLWMDNNSLFEAIEVDYGQGKHNPRKYLTLIVISETEKIEVGEDIYHFPTKTLAKFVKGDLHVAKVLILPEQFSPKHLQAIVDGKMKDGDKVLVECESIAPHPSLNDWIVIKLNSQGYVTLYKVEEKMYTREEVYVLLNKHQSDYRTHVRKTNNWSFDITEWFEQNIK
jgi:hypothetical protein